MLQICFCPYKWNLMAYKVNLINGKQINNKPFWFSGELLHSLFLTGGMISQSYLNSSISRNIQEMANNTSLHWALNVILLTMPFISFFIDLISQLPKLVIKFSSGILFIYYFPKNMFHPLTNWYVVKQQYNPLNAFLSLTRTCQSRWFIFWFRKFAEQQ